MSKKPVCVIGAGLTGSLLTIYLAKRGHKVEVYERRPDMRKADIYAGKSINLAISARGINALKKIGIEERILSKAIPMKGRRLHLENGDLVFQPYSKNENEYINSISRADLNTMLMDEAEKFPNVKFHFEARCSGMDFQKNELYIEDLETGRRNTYIPETVIGTDGSASALRMDFLKMGNFNFSQEYEKHGYKELNIPANADGSFKIEKNALHIWPRGDYMMIALPNVSGDFTCTLFMSSSGASPSLEAFKTKAEVEKFFQQKFPDAIELMPTLAEDYFNNPTGSLLTIKCFPWNNDGNALLMGDASHAIVPFLGQGMNSGFEDCFYFDELLERYGSDWTKIFNEFSRIRKADADAIAEMAQENYIEMRDLVSHKDFLLKKKAEVLLEEKHPEEFISKYAMVSFHNFPYSIAQKRGKIQDSILMEMCSKIDKIEELDLDLAFEKIVKGFEAAGINSKDFGKVL